ncbi:MAG: lipid A biosynthesis (KDO)2-(lauroyl)-lipid IVA acyltransferase [Tannerellaceae bacterium]|jgi:predicted LPLAT superfamily acyltransferase|nr:lipid A biosynthesis (KDO)2-(lauroyl)-lipid IVA acyltransferase [Tannerellaceae bacterium]
MQESPQWKGKTGGGVLGQQGLIFFFKFLNLRMGYFVMTLVVPFYMLFSYTNSKIIYQFFRKRMGATPWRSFAGTCRNHYVFGQIILDRFVLFAKGQSPFELEVTGNEHFTRLINGEKGFLIAGSHIGNFEIAGYLLRQEKKKINALVYAGETETVRRHREKILKNNHIHLIPVMDDMSHLFAVHTALRNGEVVTIPSDRMLGSHKSLTCNFLNGEADFPIGTFSLAVALEVEALSVFAIKTSDKKYTVYVKPVKTDVREADTITRQERIAGYVRSYVSDVETIVRRYPEQWFNYYEFWKA